jgi:hypothetical protein
MLMTRRKIIAQTMIGSETRRIKAKLRNASCLWDTHQGDLWVLDFIRRSPPCPRNIVQHDCENVNDRRRIPPSAAEMRAIPLKTGACLAAAMRPKQHAFSTENSPSRFEFGLSSRLIRRNGARFCPIREIENSGNSTTSFSRIRSPCQVRLPITPFAAPGPRY